MGLAGADGSYWAYAATSNGKDPRVEHRFAIRLQNSANNVRLLSAAKQLIGSGSVPLRRELLGYYVTVKFECADKICIKFR